MLQTGSVDNKTYGLILDLLNLDYLKNFILAGRTGLALQIGHRRSDDIDLFTTSDFDQNQTLENLEQELGFSMDFIENNTLKGFIRGVKVDILAHKYNYIKDFIVEDGIRIASMEDISAMKLNAIANDGTRVKDL